MTINTSFVRPVNTMFAGNSVSNPDSPGARSGLNKQADAFVRFGNASANPIASVTNLLKNLDKATGWSVQDTPAGLVLGVRLDNATLKFSFDDTKKPLNIVKKDGKKYRYPSETTVTVEEGGATGTRVIPRDTANQLYSTLVKAASPKVSQQYQLGKGMDITELLKTLVADTKQGKTKWTQATPPAFKQDPMWKAEVVQLFGRPTVSDIKKIDPAFETTLTDGTKVTWLHVINDMSMPRDYFALQQPGQPKQIVRIDPDYVTRILIHELAQSLLKKN